jgi:mono/diheme cytochrome c family protein
MNTRKQVLLMSMLLGIMLIVIGIYAAWYPSRAEDAAAHFDEATAERGSILFARNCRLCHGDLAEGGALGARLPAAPALDRPDLQGFTETTATVSAAVNSRVSEFRVSSATPFKANQVILIGEERMQITGIDGSTLRVKRGVDHTEAQSHASNAVISVLDEATLAERRRLITNTIACGRVGTAMPAWAQSQNGPLSDEQIRQLVSLITQARWDLVEHEINIEDLLTTKANIKGEPADWARLRAPLSADSISMAVTDVSVFNENEAIRIGEERLRVTAVPQTTQENGRTVQIRNARDKSGIVQVQRGILGSTPLDHGVEETIYRFPEVAEPATNQTSCGQIARPAAPAGDPELIEPFEGQSVEVIAQNVVFNVRSISVRTGGRVRLRLDNKDVGVDHNIAVYRSSTDLTPAATGSVGLVFKGPAVDDTAFDTPSAGNYFFRCDVHPTTMTGTFTVQ